MPRHKIKAIDMITLRIITVICNISRCRQERTTIPKN
jgi:hypothetical protein